MQVLQLVWARMRMRVWALVQALIVAGLVTVVFEDGFLVRLP